MSDLMLLGTLRMPESSIAGDCAGFMQFVAAARGAADRIESDAKLIGQLRAKLEAAEKDAERYRWVRSEMLPFNAYASGNPNWTFPGYGPRGANLDEAIDAALAQRQGEGS
ncbi:hypothetical protein [Burkholderia pseudomultivorans]|uniref:hypothetical protein n=1 Tax=Burkholderia pseudomultivorans TaxID=1207504 RepID=UPI000B20F95F|nr:hypothetical protein [Burkholderia pseudomultivorans]